MRDPIILLVHLIATLARLMGPGGLRTVGPLSLLVSDIEPVEVGDRGVFMVSQNGRGATVPVGGQGILLLNPQNRVIGEPWSLDDIRSAARAQARNPQ